MVQGSELCFWVRGCGVECFGFGDWDFECRVVELKVSGVENWRSASAESLNLGPRPHLNK